MSFPDFWEQRKLHYLHEMQRANEQTKVKAYLNYTHSLYPVRNINIDCDEVAPDEPSAIRAACQHMRDAVARKFGEKLASMLHYGTEPTTYYSESHYFYKRGGREWHEI